MTCSAAMRRDRALERRTPAGWPSDISGIVLLRRARDGDRVLRRRTSLPGEDAAVVRRRIPGEDLRASCASLNRAFTYLIASMRVLRVDRDVALLVLLGAAEGPEERPRMAMFVSSSCERPDRRPDCPNWSLIFLPPDAQVVPGVRAVAGSRPSPRGPCGSCPGRERRNRRRRSTSSSSGCRWTCSRERRSSCRASSRPPRRSRRGR